MADSFGSAHQNLAEITPQHKTVDLLEGYLSDKVSNLPDYFNSEAVAWILSQGQSFCNQLYTHPEKIDRIAEDQIDWDCVFDGLAISLYESKFGKSIPSVNEIDGRW